MVRAQSKSTVLAAPPIAVARAVNPSLRVALGILGFAVLTALAAQVRVPVPWSPVPMTLHLLAVLLTGLTLAPAQAAAAMMVYVACGAVGLPVFSPDSQGILGATGGYIVGFVPAACVASVLRGRGDASSWRLALAAIGGTLVVFGCGIAGLLAWASFSGFDPLTTARNGSLPFVPKALVEVGLAVSGVTAAGGLRRRWLDGS